MTIRKIDKKLKQLAEIELERVEEYNNTFPFKYPAYLGIIKELYYQLSRKERPDITQKQADRMMLKNRVLFYAGATATVTLGTMGIRKRRKKKKIR